MYQLRKHQKSYFPAANFYKSSEEVPTNIIYFNTQAVFDRHQCSQSFFGVKTRVADTRLMKTDTEFVNTFDDNIRSWRALEKLFRNRVQPEISKKVVEILMKSHIDD